MAPLGPKGLPRLWLVLFEGPKDPFTGLICPSPDQPATPAKPCAGMRLKSGPASAWALGIEGKLGRVKMMWVGGHNPDEESG